MGKGTNYIGEIKTMNCGEMITIVGKTEKRNYYKMCTSDGFEFEGLYHSFKEGTINPDYYKNHIGESKIMDCGKIVTIVGKSDKKGFYKMQTSDGFEFEGRYHSFKERTINPDFYKNHIGETKTMKCGETVTIIEETEKRDYYKMRASDGFEFEGKYDKFKKGILNPDYYKNHIGETKTMNCGEVITIIEVSEKPRYYKMRASDGFEFEGKYNKFKKGILNPDYYKNHIGETNAMKCGEIITIVEKTDKRGIYKMRTSDGFKFEGTYYSFKNRTIKPNLYKSHVGETKTMKCGLSAKCTNYKDTKNITIYFEDGYKKNQIFYSKFNKGAVSHPDLDIKNPNRDFHGYRVVGNRINVNGDVYYNAIRLSDGEKVYMTPQMMMAAEKRQV